MVKSGGFPAVDGVTVAAILPKPTVMVVIFLVAGKTSGGRALEYIVNVAVCAFYFGVFAFQLES